MNNGPSWTVIITPTAEKDLRKIPHNEQERIRIAMRDFGSDPTQGDVRKLQGKPDEWRLRVGDWRIRFAFDGGTRSIVILRVLPRGRAYR